MKTTLALFTLLSAISSSLIAAADNNSAASSVDLQITRAEVSATLKQYEKVRLLVLDAQLEQQLQLADSNAPKAKAKELDSRIDILNRELARLRAVVVDAMKAANEDMAREAEIMARLREKANIVDPDPQMLDVALSIPDSAGKGDLANHLNVLDDLRRYTEAKLSYLRVKAHLQQLDLLRQ